MEAALRVAERERIARELEKIARLRVHGLATWNDEQRAAHLRRRLVMIGGHP